MGWTVFAPIEIPCWAIPGGVGSCQAGAYAENGNPGLGLGIINRRSCIDPSLDRENSYVHVKGSLWGFSESRQWKSSPRLLLWYSRRMNPRLINIHKLCFFFFHQRLLLWFQIRCGSREDPAPRKRAMAFFRKPKWKVERVKRVQVWLIATMSAARISPTERAMERHRPISQNDRGWLAKIYLIWRHTRNNDLRALREATIASLPRQA